jgi:hypothetical protein
MVVLTAAFTKEVPDATIELYVDSLADLPDEALLGVATEIVLTSRWLPTIAELRERTVNKLDPSLIPPTPDQAWGQVLSASANVRNGLPVSTHPSVITALNAVGGLAVVGMSKYVEAERKQFLAHYSALWQKARSEALALGSSAILSLNESTTDRTPKAIEAHRPAQESF